MKSTPSIRASWFAIFQIMSLIAAGLRGISQPRLDTIADAQLLEVSTSGRRQPKTCSATFVNTMNLKTNRLASEIVGYEIANALSHAPGFMVGALSQTKKGMQRDGTLSVKAYVRSFVNSLRLDDEMAQKHPGWRRAA